MFGGLYISLLTYIYNERWVFKTNSIKFYILYNIIYLYCAIYTRRDIVYKGTISLKNRSCDRALSNRTLSTKSYAIL